MITIFDTVFFSYIGTVPRGYSLELFRDLGGKTPILSNMVTARRTPVHYGPLLMVSAHARVFRAVLRTASDYGTAELFEVADEERELVLSNCSVSIGVNEWRRHPENIWPLAEFPVIFDQSRFSPSSNHGPTLSPEDDLCGEVRAEQEFQIRHAVAIRVELRCVKLSRLDDYLCPVCKGKGFANKDENIRALMRMREFIDAQLVALDGQQEKVGPNPLDAKE